MNIGLKDPTSGRRLGTTPHHADTRAEGGHLGWGQRVDIFADPDQGWARAGAMPRQSPKLAWQGKTHFR